MLRMCTLLKLIPYKYPLQESLRHVCCDNPRSGVRVRLGWDGPQACDYGHSKENVCHGGRSLTVYSRRSG
ncbi:hypothetical protein [Frog virus 3]